MTDALESNINPKLDLVLTRVIDISPEIVWSAWTEPNFLKKWFTPAPWTTISCEIDLRPGGAFKTVMRSPEGEEFPNTGCYLDIVPGEKLVWTSVLQPGYRPAPRSSEDISFTAAIYIEPHVTGTKYTAIAMHADEAGHDAHEAMGFQDGWGAALNQLIELADANSFR